MDFSAEMNPLTSRSPSPGSSRVFRAFHKKLSCTRGPSFSCTAATVVTSRLVMASAVDPGVVEAPDIEQMSGVVRVCACQQCARCRHRVDRRPCERLDCDVQSEIGNCLCGAVQARPGTVDILLAANEVTRTQMITAAGGGGQLPHILQCRPAPRFGTGNGPAGEELDLTEPEVVVRRG